MENEGTCYVKRNANANSALLCTAFVLLGNRLVSSEGLAMFCPSKVEV